MSRHRTHRADGNQGEIVTALRATGHSVLILSQVGGGAPDLLAARAKTMALLEVKVPGEELSTEQIIWRSNNDGFRVYVVRSPQEAIDAMSDAIRRS